MLKALRLRSPKFWPKILTPYFSLYVSGKWLHSCRSKRLLRVFLARKVKLHHKLQILGLNLSKNRNNKAELVVPITFNITLLQSISHFASSLSPCLLRKNEFSKKSTDYQCLICKMGRYCAQKLSWTQKCENFL